LVGESSREEPFVKGMIRAIFCNATWTQSRLLEAGYAVSELCRLCNTGKDTMYHRCWECPESLQTRLAVAGPGLCALAAEHGIGKPLHPLFDRMLAEHPAAWLTKAFEQRRGDDSAAGRGIVYKRFDAEGMEVQEDAICLKGDLFSDGSCTRCPTTDAQRAGWAIIELDANDKLAAFALWPRRQKVSTNPAVRGDHGTGRGDTVRWRGGDYLQRLQNGRGHQRARGARNVET
jgi:hypothetical protein